MRCVHAEVSKNSLRTKTVKALFNKPGRMWILKLKLQEALLVKAKTRSSSLSRHLGTKVSFITRKVVFLRAISAALKKPTE